MKNDKTIGLIRFDKIIEEKGYCVNCVEVFDGEDSLVLYLRLFLSRIIDTYGAESIEIEGTPSDSEIRIIFKETRNSITFVLFEAPITTAADEQKLIKLFNKDKSKVFPKKPKTKTTNQKKQHEQKSTIDNQKKQHERKPRRKWIIRD